MDGLYPSSYILPNCVASCRCLHDFSWHPNSSQTSGWKLTYLHEPSHGTHWQPYSQWGGGNVYACRVRLDVNDATRLPHKGSTASGTVLLEWRRLIFLSLLFERSCAGLGLHNQLPPWTVRLITSCNGVQSVLYSKISVLGCNACAVVRVGMHFMLNCVLNQVLLFVNSTRAYKYSISNNIYMHIYI